MIKLIKNLAYIYTLLKKQNRISKDLHEKIITAKGAYIADTYFTYTSYYSLIKYF